MTILPPTTLLTISLASTEVVDVPRSSQMGELMAMQSSPSQLDIGTPSQATTPKSPASLLLGFASSEVSVPSPIAVSSPADVPDFVKISLDYLRGLTKKIIEVVLAGRDTFDTFKPMLTNSLNNLKLVGDVDVVQRCSEAISRLEGQLRFLEALGRADIQAQIASTFEDIRAEELNKYEAAQRHIAEEEVEVEQLQQLHAQKQVELTLSNTSLENLREKIAAAEVELTRMKAQFKREESIVTELNVKSAASLVNYRAKAGALEEAKKEVAAMLSSEDELRKRAEMLVRADHEEKLSDIKSQLTSFDLMN